MDLKIEFCNENQMYAIDAYPLLNVKQEVITIYMQRTDTRPAMMRCSCIWKEISTNDMPVKLKTFQTD